jgi:hypothetical protein
MKRFFHLLIIFSLIFSCGKKAPSQFTESEKRKIEIEVSSKLSNYYLDIKTKGLTAEFKYLDTTDQFFWVPPGYDQPIGFDSVKTAINNNAAKFKSVNNTWTTLIIHPISSELATYSGNIHSVIMDTSETEIKMNLIETGVVIKRSSGWKLLSGQTNIIQ